MAFLDILTVIYPLSSLSLLITYSSPYTHLPHGPIRSRVSCCFHFLCLQAPSHDLFLLSWFAQLFQHIHCAHLKIRSYKPLMEENSWCFSFWVASSSLVLIIVFSSFIVEPLLYYLCARQIVLWWYSLNTISIVSIFMEKWNMGRSLSVLFCQSGCKLK